MSDTIRKYRTPLPAECQADECDGDPIARGLCRRHYNAWRRSGKFKPAPLPPVECVVPWCDSTPLARGLCYTHYNKWNQRRRAGTASESGTELAARGKYKCKECHRPIVEHSVVEPCA